jgi:putative isomerase
MIPQDFADRMIKTHLLSTDEFWATHGVRSLSKTEALYDPAGGYWQGPVWVISNYLMMHGLLNYGYAKEAIELANKTVDFLVADYKETKGMNECYDPDTGAPTADGNFVSWNLLAEHMLEEAQSGYDPTALDAK